MDNGSLQAQMFANLPPNRLWPSTALLALVGGLLCAFGIWAALAEIDRQVRAPGTIIASSRSQFVQAVDGGSVQKVYVRAGDAVEAGDLLAELDPTRFEASAEEIESRLASLNATIERLQAERDGVRLRFTDPLLVDKHKAMIQSQIQLHVKRRTARRQELAGIRASLQFARDELNILERLAETGDAAESELLRARREVSELKNQVNNRRNEFRQQTQVELAEAQSEADQVEQVLTQRREALDSTQLFAPMAGVVKNVQFNTEGAVLKAGDVLLEIVPSDDPLIVEARVVPADVGLLRPGLPVNVNVDAYDSSIYGSIKGSLIYISPDTLEDEHRRDDVPTFRVHIEIGADALSRMQTREMEIFPGMTASVEILTGKRTVANYLLKPIHRTISAALTEP